MKTQFFTGEVTRGSGFGLGPGDAVSGNVVFNTNDIIYDNSLFDEDQSFLQERVETGLVANYSPYFSLKIHFDIGYSSWDEKMALDYDYRHPQVWGFNGTNTFTQIEYHAIPPVKFESGDEGILRVTGQKFSGIQYLVDGSSSDFGGLLYLAVPSPPTGLHVGSDL